MTNMMRPMLAVLLLALCGCGPRCMKSHLVVTHHPRRVDAVPMMMGEVMTVMPVETTEHDEAVEVCDYYEGQQPR